MHETIKNHGRMLVKYYWGTNKQILFDKCNVIVKLEREGKRDRFCTPHKRNPKFKDSDVNECDSGGRI